MSHNDRLPFLVLKSTLTLSSVEVNSNILGGTLVYGAGIFAESSILEVIKSTFTKNTDSTATEESYGGGIFSRSSNVGVYGSTFTGNQVVDGGAIYFEESGYTLDIFASTFTGTVYRLLSFVR